MPRVCQLTGKKTISGFNVSHANNHTKRTFKPNLKVKRFFLPEENRYVTLKVSAHAIRTINKLGLARAIKEAKARGTWTGTLD